MTNPTLESLYKLYRSVGLLTISKIASSIKVSGGQLAEWFEVHAKGDEPYIPLVTEDRMRQVVNYFIKECGYNP